MLIMRGATISVAESCTGGMLSHLLNSVTRIERFFRNRHRRLFRQIKEKNPRHFQQNAYELRSSKLGNSEGNGEKVRALTGTDFSIATTGNLGPNAIEGKERGLSILRSAEASAPKCGH